MDGSKIQIGQLIPSEYNIIPEFQYDDIYMFPQQMIHLKRLIKKPYK
jgi:hypothetical protein